MTRTQRRIGSIQRELDKLLDVGASTEAQGSVLLPMYLKQARAALEAAYQLAC